MTAHSGISERIINALRFAPMTRYALKEAVIEGDGPKALSDAIRHLTKREKVAVNADGLLYLPGVDYAPLANPKTETTTPDELAIAYMTGFEDAQKKLKAELSDALNQAVELAKQNDSLKADLLKLQSKQDKCRINHDPIGYIAVESCQIHDTEAEAMEFAQDQAKPGQQIMIAAVTNIGQVPTVEISWEK